MKRLMAVAATVVACLAVPGTGGAAAPGTTVCAQDVQAFSGSASTLVVPAGGYCAIANASIAQDLILRDGAGADVSNTTIGRDVLFGNGAGAGFVGVTIVRDVIGAPDGGAGLFDTTIGRDLSLQGVDGGADLAGVKIGHDFRLSDGAGTHMERTTIGHDFVASRPRTVQTGKIAPDTPGGPVQVGHDVLIDGAPSGRFVFDGICNLHVGHDMRVTNRTVTLGFGIAALGCDFENQPGNTIDHDLVVTGNTAAVGVFGPSSLRIARNHVGHDLVFSGNTAFVPGGFLEVTDNVVGHDALCTANTPAVTATTPNVAGHVNTCG